MKKLLVTVFFLNMLASAQTNNGIAFYGFKMVENDKIERKIDSLKSKVSQKMLQKIQNQIKSSKDFSQVEFSLKFNKDFSSFNYIDKMEVEEGSLSNRLRDLIVQANRKYNYNFKSKIITRQIEFEGEKFLIQQHLDSLKWQLENQQKNIGGYLCFKATAFKKKKFPSGIKKIPVVAWYSPTIPISSGPYEYNGLPGLIIELKEGNKIIFLSKINFKKQEVFPIKLKGKKVTEEEFEQIWRRKMPKRF